MSGVAGIFINLYNSVNIMLVPKKKNRLKRKNFKIYFLTPWLREGLPAWLIRIVI